MRAAICGGMIDTTHHALFVVASLVAITAAVFDMRTGSIPNKLTIPVLLLAPPFHVARMLWAKQGFDAGLQEAAFSLGGAAMCAIVPLLLFRQGAMGGGDVKLLAALGAILQPSMGVEAQMYGFCAGAVFVVGRLAYEGKLFGTIRNASVVGANLFLPKTRQKPIDESTLAWLRLGPAVAVGVMCAAFLHF